MNNGKQSEQLLKVLGGHSASLDRTSKCRGLSKQPLYSGGHKAMQHKTRNWNNFDKCEPEQQYRLGTVSYKIIKYYIIISVIFPSLTIMARVIDRLDRGVKTIIQGAKT